MLEPGKILKCMRTYHIIVSMQASACSGVLLAHGLSRQAALRFLFCIKIFLRGIFALSYRVFFYVILEEGGFTRVSNVCPLHPFSSQNYCVKMQLLLAEKNLCQLLIHQSPSRGGLRVELLVLVLSDASFCFLRPLALGLKSQLLSMILCFRQQMSVNIAF